MTWIKKRITIVAKAYPEHSKSHGCVACTAGITDQGEWIRLYPIDMRHFIGPLKLSKFDVIEVECQPDCDKLSRRESYKIRPETLRIIDRSLTKPKVDWDARDKLMLPLLDWSVEDLVVAWKHDKRSIGLIKPKWLTNFFTTEELESHERASWSFTTTLDGVRIPTVTRIPHIFKYHFNCAGCEEGRSHTMQCEDWELFESYRSWSSRYPDMDELWSKLKGRYFGWMLGSRDLYFIMGMYSQYPTWFIIGLYYPPKKRVKALVPAQSGGTR